MYINVGQYLATIRWVVENNDSPLIDSERDIKESIDKAIIQLIEDPDTTAISSFGFHVIKTEDEIEFLIDPSVGVPYFGVTWESFKGNIDESLFSK